MRRDASTWKTRLGYEVVGFIDDDRRLRGETIEGVNVLGDNESMIDLVKTLRISELILAITNTQTISDEMMNALLLCRELGLRVVTMATVYERLTGRVPIDYVGRDLYMVLPMDDSAIERAYMIAKRFIDMGAGLAGLVAIALAVIPIAIANRLTSPGPLFFGTPSINQPQVAILGTGAIKKRVAVVDDMIAIRSIAFFTMWFDHRIVDGALGGMFLEAVREHLEGFEADRKL